MRAEGTARSGTGRAGEGGLSLQQRPHLVEPTEPKHDLGPRARPPSDREALPVWVDVVRRDGKRRAALLFYVMPYIEAETLRDRLDRDGQLGVEEGGAHHLRRGGSGRSRTPAGRRAPRHQAERTFSRAKAHSLFTVLSEVPRASARLSDAQPAEVAELHDLCRAGVLVPQGRRRASSRANRIFGLVPGPRTDALERDPDPLPTALLPATPTGVVDEDAAHRLGRGAEEVAPVFPGLVPGSDQPQIGFVDERPWAGGSGRAARS